MLRQLTEGEEHKKDKDVHLLANEQASDAQSCKSDEQCHHLGCAVRVTFCRYIGPYIKGFNCVFGYLARVLL